MSQKYIMKHKSSRLVNSQQFKKCLLWHSNILSVNPFCSGYRFAPSAERGIHGCDMSTSVPRPHGEGLKHGRLRIVVKTRAGGIEWCMRVVRVLYSSKLNMIGNSALRVRVEGLRVENVACDYVRGLGCLG